MAMDAFIALAFAVIAGIAIGMIYRKVKKLALIMGVATMVITYIMAIFIPVIFTVSIIPGIFVALFIYHKKIDLVDWGIAGFVGFMIILILFYGILHVWQSQPEIVTREITQSLDLVDLGKEVRIGGYSVFLSGGTIKQSDYYDYKYIDGIGTRKGRISQFTVLVVEDANLTDRGTLRRYQTFKTRKELSGILKFLCDDLPKKFSEGDEQVEIYVPVGTVERTIEPI